MTAFSHSDRGLLSPAWRLELAQPLPELGAPETSAPADRDGYLRLFDALAQLISALAAIQPIVVIIEDLHWADEMSTRLLLFLARRLENQAVLLLVTTRLEEVEETPALRRALEELAAESRVAQLMLTALSRQETKALVEALLQRGTQPSETTTIAGQVWALSEGNPFMIVERARAPPYAQGPGMMKSTSLRSVSMLASLR